MADVDMPDASPPGPSKAKLSPGNKVAKSGTADAGSDNKKRFEVKKVRQASFRRNEQLVN